jgi:FMN phosphatase YigB (HAD superfamily)
MLEMAVRAVFFDVGETLVDEERYWREMARAAGLRPHLVSAALGATIARGDEHWRLWEQLGVERPLGVWERIPFEADDLYPDAIPCLEALRAGGLLVGVAGNQSATMEEWGRAALPADVVATSAGLGAEKPDRAFFDRIVELVGTNAGEVAYVGDRVDNDVVAARAAGLVAIHVRRGPWGLLQQAPDGVTGIDALAELPAALAAPA